MDTRPMRGALSSAAGLAALLAAAACDGGDKPAPAAPGPAKPHAGFVEVSHAAGIDFKMSFLPTEQGEKFKINLYDHGSGVAVADVDGDGADDVYFVNQLGKNGFFRNAGGGKFTDVTTTSGAGLGDRVCIAATFGDVDGDGDQDLYVTSARGGNAFFRNEGGFRFVDATEVAGLKLTAHSESAAFFDYDGDGDLDLFVTNTAKWTTDRRDATDRYYTGVDGMFAMAAAPTEHNVFYANDGKGVFTDVTEATGLAGPGWGGDIAVVDYDGDGRPDLLLGNMFGSSTLYHNEGGGSFRDVTRAALGRTSWGTVGVKAFDYDGDGLFDFMLADMHSDMWMGIDSNMPVIEEKKKYDGIMGPNVERGVTSPEAAREFHERLNVKTSEVVFGNTLFRNLGNGKFEETSDAAGAETFWPWGMATADFDLDGSIDVFIPTGMGYPLFYWRNYLLMNSGKGTFTDRGSEFGIEPRAGGPYVEELIGGKLASRSSRSAAVADYDGDGRPDLFVNNFNERASLYHNEFPKRHWVALRLKGTKSNRDAIGAVATVRAGGRTLVRQVDAASGYLSQSTKTLLFGLGDGDRIDVCEIRWPSGAKQSTTALKIDAVNDVTEPSGR